MVLKIINSVRNFRISKFEDVKFQEYGKIQI